MTKSYNVTINFQAEHSTTVEVDDIYDEDGDLDEATMEEEAEQKATDLAEDLKFGLEIDLAYYYSIE